MTAFDTALITTAALLTVAGLRQRWKSIRAVNPTTLPVTTLPARVSASEAIDKMDKAQLDEETMVRVALDSLRAHQNAACNHAHNEAIERAARMCEKPCHDPDQLAARIRAMKVTPLRRQHDDVGHSNDVILTAHSAQVALLAQSQ